MPGRHQETNIARSHKRHTNQLLIVAEKTSGRSVTSLMPGREEIVPAQIWAVVQLHSTTSALGNSTFFGESVRDVPALRTKQQGQVTTGR